MRTQAAFALAAVALLAACDPAPSTTPPVALAKTAPIPGSDCPAFPADNAWHLDVSKLPVNAHSGEWLASMKASITKLHPDFGTSGDPAAPYGIPFKVVAADHAKVSVTFDYADESDHVPYPLGADVPIEGGANADGDRHAIVIDAGTCKLYETFDTHLTAGGATAGSGATWDLRSNALRPAGWTSADAAGLPILPGLLRLDEVQAGVVDHAIRVTAARTDRSYLWPARHQAGAQSNAALPPMGARFRLKAGVDLSKYSVQTQVVLKAMQHYGLVVADNGSNWYFQGAASNQWPDQLISELKSVPASWFEAVDISKVQVSPDSGQTRP